MSVEAVKLVLDRSRSKGTTRLVLVIIAEHAGGPDHYAFPGIKTIARQAGGVTERTVKRSIAELEQLGEIEVSRDKRYNQYRIRLATGDKGVTYEPDRLVTRASPVESSIGDILGSDRGRQCHPNHQKPSGAQRSSAHPHSDTDQSALPQRGDGESRAGGVSARARAQKPKADRRDGQPGDAAMRRDVETLRRLNDQQEVRQILSSALFEYAIEDRRTIPPNVIESLATSEHARPVLALYAVQRVNEAAKKAHAKSKPCNTIAMLITAFGAQRHGRGKPWNVPAEFVKGEWSAHKARANAGQNLQAHLQELRHRKGIEANREGKVASSKAAARRQLSHGAAG